MSVRDGKDYLYLIWKCDSTRRQYIVGQLSKNGQYEFRYCGEINEAIKAGFKPLVSFEKVSEVYRSEELFPVFSSRLPDKKRKDIGKILKKYQMEEYDAYKLLKMSGARLPIDNLQFIDPILDIENEFQRKIYMAGVRYYLGCGGMDCNNAISVIKGEEVFLVKEPDNKYDKYAIKVVNVKEELLGYIPRFYSKAFTRIINNRRKITCYIESVDMNKCCSECIELTVKVYK